METVTGTRLPPAGALMPTVSMAGSRRWSPNLLVLSYRGTSMGNTFLEGDILLVAPSLPEDIRLGDVIAYRRCSTACQVVVHRVIAREGVGFLTRGDSMPMADSQPIHPESLVGCVRFVQRDGRVRRVWGSTLGRLHMALSHLGTRIIPLVRPLYRWLRASGLVRLLWKPSIAQIHCATGEGELVKYVHRRKTIARWWPETGQFRCRKPYDLVIAKPFEGDAKCQ